MKGVIVTDDAGHGGFTVAADVASDCGVVSFARKNLKAGTFFVYYLPYNMDGGGAGLQFSWENCTNEDPTIANECVQGRDRRRTDVNAATCAFATQAAIPVVGLEMRDAFNSFTTLEMMATAAETAAAVATLVALPSGPPFAGVFSEDSQNSVFQSHHQTTLFLSILGARV